MQRSKAFSCSLVNRFDGSYVKFGVSMIQKDVISTKKEISKLMEAFNFSRLVPLLSCEMVSQIADTGQEQRN